LNKNPDTNGAVNAASEAESGIGRNPSQLRILIVEDDAKTGHAIRRGLEMEGYLVSLSQTGDQGVLRSLSEAFDLLVLDWMLPGRSGIEVLKSVRAQGRALPVLLLTARDTIEDRVEGLDSGADDYLVKPFAFAELLARIRVLLRRTSSGPHSRRKIGNLVLDFQSRRLWRGREEIVLTPREFDLLLYMMRHEGEVVTRQMLAREVWREPNRLTPLDNVIDVHVGRLRRKLNVDPCHQVIHTVRGVGFIMSEGARPCELGIIVR